MKEEVVKKEEAVKEEAVKEEAGDTGVKMMRHIHELRERTAREEAAPRTYTSEEVERIVGERLVRARSTCEQGVEPGPAPAPSLAPPPAPSGQAVAVEFMDGRARRYLVQALTLDSEALTMTTPAGTVAIPARQVRETVLLAAPPIPPASEPATEASHG
jgi:hypothetical protein